MVNPTLPKLLLFSLVGVFVGTPARAAEDDLAHAGYAILTRHCARCHGTDLVVAGFDVRSRQSLFDGGYVHADGPESSKIWRRAGIAGDMPPDGEPRPTPEESLMLRAWIAAGAPFPPLEGERAFVTTLETLTVIRNHLRSLDPNDRAFARYFTLTNLNNDAANVTTDEYRLAQAALSKGLNSLSWERRIVPPRPLDEGRTLFAIDLRDYGWHRGGLWRELLVRYPYGLRFDRTGDEATVRVATEVAELTGTRIPFLRADWFTAYATRGDLYHRMLGLPEEVSKLERALRVDVEDDFLRNRLLRAGFATSGVSSQNRLVDRHDSAYGSYWKSYDFRPNGTRSDLFRYSLGPVFEANPYPAQAFEHDGGEMIFSLPNGLHGYLLTDGEGRRIETGPIDVVSDRLRTDGSPVIVNGVSCMACHKHGMIPLHDTVRDGTALLGTALAKVRDLFPTTKVMDEAIARDSRDYLAALELAVGPLLPPGTAIAALPEPVGAVTRRFHRDLGAAEVAAELGLPGPEALIALVRANGRLRELGLGPLVHGERIKREVFEGRGSRVSGFHRIAVELDVGTPHLVFVD